MRYVIVGDRSKRVVEQGTTLEHVDVSPDSTLSRVQDKLGGRPEVVGMAIRAASSDATRPSGREPVLVVEIAANVAANICGHPDCNCHDIVTEATAAITDPQLAVPETE